MILSLLTATTAAKIMTIEITETNGIVWLACSTCFLKSA